MILHSHSIASYPMVYSIGIGHPIGHRHTHSIEVLHRHTWLHMHSPMYNRLSYMLHHLISMLCGVYKYTETNRYELIASGSYDDMVSMLSTRSLPGYNIGDRYRIYETPYEVGDIIMYKDSSN